MLSLKNNLKTVKSSVHDNIKCNYQWTYLSMNSVDLPKAWIVLMPWTVAVIWLIKGDRVFASNRFNSRTLEVNTMFNRKNTIASGKRAIRKYGETYTMLMRENIIIRIFIRNTSALPGNLTSTKKKKKKISHPITTNKILN